MKSFESRISEIDAQFQAQDDELRAELRAVEEVLARAKDRSEGLRVRYESELLRGNGGAVALKLEKDVAQDEAEALTRRRDQLAAELRTGELAQAQLRRHAAIVSACECEGAHAIHEAIAAAEAARDAYRQALAEMVRVQRRVAEIGRRSYTVTARLGGPLDAARVARYRAEEFAVEAPVESASATSFM